MKPIKTNSKFLAFVEIAQKTKTVVIMVNSKNHGDNLGIIKWHTSWRKYCFFPTIEYETVWSDDCLLDIFDMLKILEISREKGVKRYEYE